jgi:hypothetical protein
MVGLWPFWGTGLVERNMRIRGGSPSPGHALKARAACGTIQGCSWTSASGYCRRRRFHHLPRHRLAHSSDLVPLKYGIGQRTDLDSDTRPSSGEYVSRFGVGSRIHRRKTTTTLRRSSIQRDSRHSGPLYLPPSQGPRERDLRPIWQGSELPHTAFDPRFVVGGRRHKTGHGIQIKDHPKET